MGGKSEVKPYVMPAQAGIHATILKHLAWIPACAGMTAQVLQI